MSAKSFLPGGKKYPSWLAIPLWTNFFILGLFRSISSPVPMLEVSFSCRVLERHFSDPLSHWVISSPLQITAHGPNGSTSHTACAQPEVITKHACMRREHSHLSRVRCECHVTGPGQWILRTHVHENELLHWYFLAFKIRYIFFLPLWKYRLVVDIFFYPGMLMIELCFLTSSVNEGGSVFRWVCVADHVKWTVL